jgi:hypothetical protein
MNDKAKPKRKVVERREAGIKAMPAPQPRTLPQDHPARSMFRQIAEAERNQLETSTTGTTPTTSTTTTPTTGTTGSTGTTPTTSVAPTRDFTRVPNSIVREAIPGGYFTGKSKQIYDCLYAMSRGAVVPVRSVRISMERLMVKADIGSDRTLRKNLARLEGVGLVTIKQIGGTQGGNEFTVFLPEEIVTPTTSTTPTTPTTPHHHDHPLQNVPVVPVVESDSGRGGLNGENKDSSAQHNTLINTNTDKKDDEALAGLVEMLKQAAKKVTGKEPSVTEADRWREIGELLAAELQIAASRTTVSSAPAFLFEHLRRRLRKSDARQIEQEVREASSGEAPPASAKPELNPEQLQEQVNIIATLMNDGASMRDLEERFGANFRPAQWHMIRSMALAQARVVRSQPPEIDK